MSNDEGVQSPESRNLPQEGEDFSGDPVLAACKACDRYDDPEKRNFYHDRTKNRPVRETISEAQKRCRGGRQGISVALIKTTDGRWVVKVRDRVPTHCTNFNQRQDGQDFAITLPRRSLNGVIHPDVIDRILGQVKSWVPEGEWDKVKLPEGWKFP